MIWFILYIGTIFAANWAVATWGIVPVGFGLYAPAAVYFVGLAFTLRDLTQEALGKRGAIAAILIGALLSWAVSPVFALASAVAFLASELLDFSVYTPLRERNWLGAVALSNAAGIVLDSMIFLWLAFGSWDFLAGQIVGKAWMTVLAVVVLGSVRVWQRRKRERWSSI